MKKTQPIIRLSLLIIIGILAFNLSAQTFKGRVVDVSGEPVPYAALYLKELMRGFTTDENGVFHATVEPGTYNCEITSLGYQPNMARIEIKHPYTDYEFRLQEQVYALKEVSIVKDREDPAYAIMRKAIAYAPYNLNRINSYSAEMYLKGSGKMEKMPALLKLSKDVRDDAKKYMNKLFILEEQREVTFTAPDHWEGRVMAYSNTFPDRVQIEITLSMLNFYKPTLLGKISPLSAGAFSYYKFKLEGCYVEGDHLVNKIKVIPRKNNPQLLSGHIYIVDNSWCVSAASLKAHSSGVDINAQITCSEVLPSVFLPISIKMQDYFDLMGFKAEAHFLASVQYHSVDLADIPTLESTPAIETISSLYISKKEAKRLKKIEELSQKEDLSTKEAYRLYNLMKEEAEYKDTLRSDYKYDRTFQSRIANLTTDSLAGERDSLYWINVRSVPLKSEEVESYVFKREMHNIVDSLTARTLKPRSIYGKIFKTLIFGGYYELNNKKDWFELYNILSYIPDHNFVDGQWVGARFLYGHKFSDNISLTIEPSLFYTTKRKKIVGDEKVTLYYAPRRKGEFFLAGGAVSADYNETCGEARIINSLASSIFGKNYLKLYDKKYITVGNRFEITNGLMFSAELTWQKRRMLDNLIYKSWFKKKATPNYPDVDNFVMMPNNELLRMSLGLEYTPGHYYRMVNNKKVYEPSVYPTFTLHYEHAFPLNTKVISPRYSMASLSAEQQIGFGLFNNIFWYANTGLFWDKKNIQFPDFMHFASTKFPVTMRNFNNSFALLNNYAYSNDTKWVQAHFSWYTPYLLFKHLPMLKRQMFDEALHLRTLQVYKHKPYTELGYSMGFNNLVRAGVFVGFKGVKYHSVGFSISLSILKRLEHIVRD